MKFKDLSPLGQTIAIGDYLKGWLETHENDSLSIAEVAEILIENNDNFTVFGAFIN